MWGCQCIIEGGHFLVAKPCQPIVGDPSQQEASEHSLAWSVSDFLGSRSLIMPSHVGMPMHHRGWPLLVAKPKTMPTDLSASLPKEHIVAKAWPRHVHALGHPRRPFWGAHAQNNANKPSNPTGGIISIIFSGITLGKVPEFVFGCSSQNGMPSTSCGHAHVVAKSIACTSPPALAILGCPSPRQSQESFRDGCPTSFFVAQAKMACQARLVGMPTWLPGLLHALVRSRWPFWGAQAQDEANNPSGTGVRVSIFVAQAKMACQACLVGMPTWLPSLLRALVRPRWPFWGA
jgi:hypothetical protein